MASENSHHPEHQRDPGCRLRYEWNSKPSVKKGDWRFILPSVRHSERIARDNHLAALSGESKFT